MLLIREKNAYSQLKNTMKGIDYLIAYLQPLDNKALQLPWKFTEHRKAQQFYDDSAIEFHLSTEFIFCAI